MKDKHVSKSKSESASSVRAKNITEEITHQVKKTVDFLVPGRPIEDQMLQRYHLKNLAH